MEDDILTSSEHKKMIHKPSLGQDGSLKNLGRIASALIYIDNSSLFCIFCFYTLHIVKLVSDKIIHIYYFIVRYDFTNIVDECCRLEVLEVVGGTNSLGASNIILNDLKFDFLGKNYFYHIQFITREQKYFSRAPDFSLLLLLLLYIILYTNMEIFKLLKSYFYLFYLVLCQFFNLRFK